MLQLSDTFENYSTLAQCGQKRKQSSLHSESAKRYKMMLPELSEDSDVFSEISNVDMEDIRISCNDLMKI
jgi:hypothetical protein